jgi:hypothetical protein
VIAQIPATRVVKQIRRAQAFAAASALWVIALLGVLPATLIHSEFGATALLAGVATVFAIGECRWPWKQVSPTSKKNLARRRKRLIDRRDANLVRQPDQRQHPCRTRGDRCWRRLRWLWRRKEGARARRRGRPGSLSSVPS